MNFKIKGGKKLKGEITTNTAKNSAVALLCASLLNKEKTILEKMPRIEEVNRITEVLKSIGVKLNWLDKHTLEIKPPKKIDIKKIDKKAAMRTRSIILLLGVLIHEFKEFKLPQAGGCKLGARTVKPHFFALENLGVDIKTKEKYYKIEHKGLKNNKIVLYEAGDTVTENAIMAASKIPGKTTIKKASANYQVQDLCNFLTKLGVKIKGIGTTTLKVYGKKELKKSLKYQMTEDPIESMLFISAAVTTNSKITINRCPIEFLELELLKLEKMGLKFKLTKPYLSNNDFTQLVDITVYPSNLKALDEKIAPRPFPGINIDNLPFFVPIATQAKGETLIHDWVYENRAIYYTELKKLGADIILADPHRFYVKGKVNLKPAEIIAPPALRPAAIILIAMLAAPGESILRNVYSIRRGYEALAKRLKKSLGAQIEKID